MSRHIGGGGGDFFALLWIKSKQEHYHRTGFWLLHLIISASETSTVSSSSLTHPRAKKRTYSRDFILCGSVMFLLLFLSRSLLLGVKKSRVVTCYMYTYCNFTYSQARRRCNRAPAMARRSSNVFISDGGIPSNINA